MTITGPTSSAEAGQTSVEYALVLTIVIALVTGFALVATGGIGGVLNTLGDVVAGAF